MRILMIAENDPAGTAIEFTKATNALGPHTCRLVTTQTRYNHAWEQDIHVPDLDADGLDELESLLRGADVFHFHLVGDEHLPLGPFTPVDFLAGKAVVHHHHGHPDFRGNPEKYQRKYRDLGRENLLVSTPDLLKKLPGARWQPNLVPTRDPRFTPPTPGDLPDEPVRIGHSPTRKDLKNTDEFLRAMGVLRKELGPERIEADVIDDAPHDDCLARKKRCHAVFDHMQGYYGVSSLESLSQGRPVIAGLDTWNRDTIRDFFGCDTLPWVAAHDEAELTDALRRMVLEQDWREEQGRDARLFMEDHWSEDRVASALTHFWENLR